MYGGVVRGRGGCVERLGAGTGIGWRVILPAGTTVGKDGVVGWSKGTVGRGGVVLHDIQ